jgi:transposase
MTLMDSNAPSGEAAATRYAVQDMDHLGLVAGMVDELGLVERIDRLIPQDLEQRHLSVGLVVKAMILNGLGFIQRVLYLMPRFFQNKPLDRLLGPGILPEHLNDDVLGRALDAIYRYGPTRLFAPLAAQAVKRLGLTGRIGHLDATSVHTDGRYNSEREPPEGVIHITKGYSRDHRPELNQVVTQLICENQAGIPLFMAALSGNSSDQTSFRATISEHIGQLQTDVGLQYIVADSALYNAATLQELGDFGWISRVPETLGLARELMLAVAGELMLSPEAQAYRALGTRYGGVRQRWLVVYTQAARQRAEKTLQKQHLKQGKTELKAFERLQNTAFACAADAEAALRAFRKQQALTTVCEAQVLGRPRYLKPGRPRQNQTPEAYDYFIQGRLASDITIHQQKLQRKSCFIIATNELDQQALPDDQVIEHYKKDQQQVEGGFRFFKDPWFMASTLFLKTPQRIMALMMIMTLCLLVYAAIEWRIRQALQVRDQTFPDQKGQPTQRPTARWVFQFFSGIRLLLISQTQRIVLSLNEHHRALLALLGNRYVDLYADSA